MTTQRLEKERAMRAEIKAARTARGGWTKQKLASWGVPWPPPRGWLVDLVRKAGEQ